MLSGHAVSCNFGTLGEPILRDKFIVNMNDCEGQNELCPSNKTMEGVYKLAYPTKVRTNTQNHTYRHPPGKPDPRQDQPGSNSGKNGRGAIVTIGREEGAFTKGADHSGGILTSNRCKNCKKPNFTREQHIERCPANVSTCSFCSKLEHYQRNCRGNGGGSGDDPGAG